MVSDKAVADKYIKILANNSISPASNQVIREIMPVYPSDTSDKGSLSIGRFPDVFIMLFIPPTLNKMNHTFIFTPAFFSMNLIFLRPPNCCCFLIATNFLILFLLRSFLSISVRRYNKPHKG